MIDTKERQVHYVRVHDIRKDFVRKINGLHNHSDQKESPIELKEFLNMILKGDKVEISTELGERVPHGWREDELAIFWVGDYRPIMVTKKPEPPK